MQTQYEENRGSQVWVQLLGSLPWRPGIIPGTHGFAPSLAPFPLRFPAFPWPSPATLRSLLPLPRSGPHFLLAPCSALILLHLPLGCGTGQAHLVELPALPALAHQRLHVAAHQEGGEDKEDEGCGKEEAEAHTPGEGRGTG